MRATNIYTYTHLVTTENQDTYVEKQGARERERERGSVGVCSKTQ